MSTLLPIVSPPRLLQREQPLPLAGIRTRTSNADEFSPATGKIPALWGRFFSQQVAQSVPGYTAQSAVYGVYSGYASDAYGPFDVTAAVQASAVPEGLVGLEVPAGPYLLFEGQGPMPQTVLAVWGAVWLYFEGTPAYTRRYAVDFEEYSGDSQVSVYIGVLPS